MFPYQDPNESVDVRVEDLLSRMTLEEKFAQMRLFCISSKQAAQVPFDLNILKEKEKCMGSMYNPHSRPTESIRAIQDWYRNNTRLGIPIAIHGEGLHGNKHLNATVFPQCIGLGSTFNRELIGKIADQIGRETRANGITMVYAPNVDLSRLIRGHKHRSIDFQIQNHTMTVIAALPNPIDQTLIQSVYRNGILTFP